MKQFENLDQLEIPVGEEKITKTVLISDLHADTWFRLNPLFLRPDGQEVTKQEIFIEFCDHIKGEVEATRLIINGDLLDVPNFDSNRFYTPESLHSEVIDKLKELRASGIDIFVTTGNHDYAFWAFDGSTEPFFKFRDPNPYERETYLLKFTPKDSRDGKPNSIPAYFVEHGHAYDICLGLYNLNIFNSLRKHTLAKRLLIRYSWLRPLDPKAFRSDREKHLHFVKSILTNLIPDNNTSGRAQRKLENYHSRSMRKWADKSKRLDISKLHKPLTWFSVIKDIWFLLLHPKFWKTRIFMFFTSLIHRKKWFENYYFKKASHAYNAVKYTQDPIYEIKGVIFGHTHLPDGREIKSNDGLVRYFNSGDWNERTSAEDPPNHHANFMIFDKHGNPLNKNGDIENDARAAVRDFIEERGYKFIGERGSYTHRGKPSNKDRDLMQSSA